MVLNVEGQDLTKLQTFELGTLGVGASFSQDVEVFGWKKGKRIFIVDVDSKELINVKGHEEIVIAP